MGFNKHTTQPARGIEDRLRLVQEYGLHTLAYSTLQAGMQYFDTPQGYIAYCEHTSYLGKTVAALGDPIAAPSHVVNILQLFAKQFPQAIYWQLGRQAAAALNDFGHYVNEAGLDSVVDLQKFQGSWRTHNSLRRAASKATRRGVVVREKEPGESPIRDFINISTSWLAGRKNCAKQCFLTRPLVLCPEQDVRTFYAYREGKLVGFRVFDPLYSGGEIIGYYADAIRVSPDAPPGTSYKIMLDAILAFKAEGRQFLTLGYSPFADMRLACGFKSSPPTHWLFSFTYHNLEHIYGQRGLANHKGRFHGDEQKVYLASKSAFPLKDIINTCSLTGINLPLQLIRAAIPKLALSSLAGIYSPNPRSQPWALRNGSQSHARSE